jgi:hypothetical protein
MGIAMEILISSQIIKEILNTAADKAEEIAKLLEE